MTEVLLVEDHPADAALIREVLSTDHELAVAEDGETAVSKLESMDEVGDQPELVLLDLRLPRRSGFEILEAVRNGFEETSFVVCTNSDSDRDRERADELGADEYVTKPIDIDEFQREIQTIEQSFLEASG